MCPAPVHEMASLDEQVQAEVLTTELFDRLVACGDYLRRGLAARASEANLTGAEFLALRELALARAPVSPSDLAFLTRCSKAQVTKVSDRLAAAGYIRKDRVPWMAHAKTLALTATGLEALTRAIICVDTKKSFAPLTKREQRQLHSLLGRLQHAFEDVRLTDEGTPEDFAAEVVHLRTTSADEGVHT